MSDLLKQIVKNLNPIKPLESNADFAAFYSTRDTAINSEYINKFLEVHDKALVFLSGTIGIGKTTELNLLKNNLSNEYLPIFPENISIDLDLDQIDSYSLLTYLRKSLCCHLGIEDDLQPYMNSLSAEFFESFNNLLCDKKVVFILDDFEKIPFEKFVVFINEFTSICKKIKACFIMTVKLNTFFDNRLVNVRENELTHYFIIPAVNVKDKMGQLLVENKQYLQDILLKRLKGYKLDSDLMNQIIENSGGVIRTLINLTREVLTLALVQEREKPIEKDLKKALNSYYNDYQRRIAPSDIPVLKRIHREKGLDPEYAKYLENGVVLEYGNEKRWYDVHPVVASILADHKTSIEDILFGDD